MKKQSKIMAVSLLVTFSMIFTGCSAANKEKVIQLPNNAVMSQSSSVKRTDDYYAAVNEKVLKEHEQGPDGGNWNWFWDLEDKVYEEQKKIIQTAAASMKDSGKNTVQVSSEYKIGALYSMAVDQNRRDAEGIEYFNKLIKSAMEAETVQAFMDELASLQYHYGFQTLLNTEVLARDDNPGEYIVQLNDLDFGVGKEEFEDEDEEVEEYLAMYFEDYLGSLLKSAGWTEDQAKQVGRNVLAFVKEIARSQRKGDYTKISIDELQDVLKNLDLKQYLGKIYQTIPMEIYAKETGSLTKLNEYLTTENLPLLKDYVYTINLNRLVPYLTSDMIKAKQKMEEDDIGDAETADVEKTAVKQTSELLKWDMGKLYTEQYFDTRKKEQTQKLVEELLDEYKTMIQEETWLTQNTKNKALKKLEHINIRIGSPEDISRYLSEYVPVSRKDGGTYLSNVLLLRGETSQKQFDKYGQKVDRSVWNILPQELVPCYYPTDNSINIPVIALNTPYFSVSASEEENLGGIGTIIGHEITHAFDDLGSQYDENGDFVNWWTNGDRQAFEEKAEKIISYYDNYKTSGIMRQDGKQTLGENIADLGAMHCLSRIVEKKGLSAEKFFESYANAWASTSDDFSAAIVSGMDEHAADKVRVNAVLASCELFYKTYGIKEDDGMYIKPEERVELW